LLETQRLQLRPVEQADLDAWAAFLADAHATRFLHFPEPHSREESKGLLDRTIARADGPAAMYAVRLRDGGATVGFVGYSPRVVESSAELELGWLLLPQFHGRGYATEAALAVRRLVPGRVVALIRVENEASKNVARKVGMAPERELEFAGFRTELFASPSP
jgi:RimJ/RimL family protein N-acetyltransferase